MTIQENYRESIEKIFNALAEMKLAKKDKITVSNMLAHMAINGYSACQNDNDYSAIDHALWLAEITPHDWQTNAPSPPA